MIISIKKLFDLGRCSHQCYSIHYWYLYHRNFVLSWNRKKKNKTKKHQKTWLPPPPPHFEFCGLYPILPLKQTLLDLFYSFFWESIKGFYMIEIYIYHNHEPACKVSSVVINIGEIRTDFPIMKLMIISDDKRQHGWNLLFERKEEKKKKKDRTTFLTLDQSEDWVLKRESQMIYI